MKLDTLKFRSLSVLDFVEEAKSWNEDDFIYNAAFHKEELKQLPLDNKKFSHYGCSKEIEHLIAFIKNLLFFFEYRHYPSSCSDEDYKYIVELATKYLPGFA